MKNYLKIAQGIDVGPVALELHAQPDLWNVDKERLYEGSPHDESDDIWVRVNDRTAFDQGRPWKEFNDEHTSVWYPAFYQLPSLRKLVFDLARRVEAERIGDILIWRLQPGKTIKPHTDKSWHADYYQKFNICIQGQLGCSFVYDDEAIEERTGDVHRFVNNVNHSVINRSKDDYIVAVVCLKLHDYSERYRRG